MKDYTSTILPGGGIDVSRDSIAVFTVLVMPLAAVAVTHAEPMLCTPDGWPARIFFTVSH